MTPTSAPAQVTWADPQRQVAFEAWLDVLSGPQQLDVPSLRLASADASFRRYLRIQSAQGTRIIMDAPPDKENCQPIVQVAQLMQAAGLRAPEVRAWDEAQGFMLLTDLGSHTMMQAMKQAGALETFAPNLPLYLQAVDALITWQLASKPDVLPNYDEALLRRELALFPDWYITQHRGITLSEAMRRTPDYAFSPIGPPNLDRASATPPPHLTPPTPMAAPGPPPGAPPLPPDERAEDRTARTPEPLRDEAE